MLLWVILIWLCWASVDRRRLLDLIGIVDRDELLVEKVEG